MRKALDPLCVDLQIPPTPQLSRTAAVWHLSTPITGRLRETSTTALDLAVALHPTPAVGGVPAAAAAELIGELEGDRGFYAGAVGWCDAARRRPLGGVHPRRTAVGRPPHRRTPTPAAGSSPNPIPTTKSPRPQRNSPPSCRLWRRNHEHPTRPARRRGRADRDDPRARRVRAGRPTNARSPKPSCAQRFSVTRRRCSGHIAEVDGEAAAGALWFRNFSTWDGVAGIYLEDLFVRPQFRRRGLARAMLATLARECVENGYTRLSWAVLDWNVDAIAALRRRRRAPAERVDHLPGVRPGVVGAGRVRVLLSPQPLHRRRAEQQDQRDERDDADGYAVHPLAASRRRGTRPPATAAAARTPQRRGPTAGRSTAPRPPPARRRR